MNEDLSKLDLIGLIDRLEPLAEPAAVSMWPQSEAWIWLGLLLFVLLAWATRRLVVRRRANAYRRAALEEIAAAGDSPERLAEILRRTALAAFPRNEVAGLHGDAWLAFLDRVGGGTNFSEGIGRTFAVAPYRPDGRASRELARLARRWIRRHRSSGRETS